MQCILRDATKKMARPIRGGLGGGRLKKRFSTKTGTICVKYNKSVRAHSVHIQRIRTIQKNRLYETGCSFSLCSLFTLTGEVRELSTVL